MADAKQLFTFLGKYAVPATNEDVTHKSRDPVKSYSVPPELHERVNQLVVSCHEAMHTSSDAVRVNVSEVPYNDTAILRMAFKFTFSMDNASRQFTQKHVTEGYKLVRDALATLTNISTLSEPKQQQSSSHLHSVVMYRNRPYAYSGNMVDGFEVAFPNVMISKDLHSLIRNHVISRIDNVISNPDIGMLNIKNRPPEIVDATVLDRSSVLLYGCTKPGKPPLKVQCEISQSIRDVVVVHTTTAARGDDDGIEDKEDDEDKNAEVPELVTFCSEPDVYEARETYEAYVHLLSNRVRGKKPIYDAKPRNAYVEKELALIQSKTSTRRKKRNVRVVNSATRRSRQERQDTELSPREQTQAIAEATALTKIVGDYRSYDDTQWLEMSLSLYKIAPKHLRSTWLEFTARADLGSRADERARLNWWDDEDSEDKFMRLENLTPMGALGNLYRWAKVDNKEEFEKVQQRLLEPMLIASMTKTSEDVANVVYKMFRFQYVCISGSKKQMWAEFVGHKWELMTDNISLKKKLGTEVQNAYLRAISKCATSARTGTEDERERNTNHAQSLMAVVMKLKEIKFKDQVMSECALRFHDKYFMGRLDQNYNLVGMENGVYDLNLGYKRDGRPEDCISMSVKLDYPEFEPYQIDIHNEESSIVEVAEIFEFMQQVFPKPRVRRYMWKFLASCLQATNMDELFHIWSGAGGNGKSKLVALVGATLGDYVGTLPVQGIQAGRQQMGSASPEMAEIRKCRFASSQEPDNGLTINTSIVKEWTGRDLVRTRDLYEKGGPSIPHWKYVLMCNDKPRLENVTDNGTWRRFVVIEFISNFVAGVPNGKYEFERDTELDTYFPSWAPWFLAILSLWFPIYKEEKLKPMDESPEIAAASQEYREDSDLYTGFLREHVVHTGNKEDKLKMDAIYSEFRSWYTGNFGERAKVPPLAHIRRHIEKHYIKKKYGSGPRAGFVGWAMSYTVEQPQQPDED